VSAPSNVDRSRSAPPPLDPLEAPSDLDCMKVRDALRLLIDDGWFLVRTRGSHQQYKHPTKLGLVTIAGHPGDDLAPGTLNSILKQAGLKS
jgi:predicted RNA binding protein YcfA (HicA-like mRNA interferase family)